jgi:hypothetical protein
MNEYEFNPIEFGYEYITEFPELAHLFGNTTFIKVTAIGDKSMGRAVYWYSYCYQYGMSDQRWKIASSSFDENDSERSGSHVVYNSVISTKEFAKNLLMHLFGTTKNSSVLIDGKERLEQDINKERARYNISHGQER